MNKCNKRKKGFCYYQDDKLNEYVCEHTDDEFFDDYTGLVCCEHEEHQVEREGYVTFNKRIIGEFEPTDNTKSPDWCPLDCKKPKRTINNGKNKTSCTK